MDYDSKIKQLERELESIRHSINSENNNDTTILEQKQNNIISQLREYRKLQYESQFVINDDYEY